MAPWVPMGLRGSEVSGVGSLGCWIPLKGVQVSLGVGAVGRQTSFGRLILFGYCASFGQHLGILRCCLGAIGCHGAVVGCCWHWQLWLVVVARCAGVVTLHHAVVILLLWELMLVSNKVNKHTMEFIGSVAELLNLPFCVSGDPEIKGSIPCVYIISF